jgi:hypothetical protein
MPDNVMVSVPRSVSRWFLRGDEGAVSKGSLRSHLNHLKADHRVMGSLRTGTPVGGTAYFVSR